MWEWTVMGLLPLISLELGPSDTSSAWWLKCLSHLLLLLLPTKNKGTRNTLQEWCTLSWVYTISLWKNEEGKCGCCWRGFVCKYFSLACEIAALWKEGGKEKGNKTPCISQKCKQYLSCVLVVFIWRRRKSHQENKSSEEGYKNGK